VDAEDLTIQIQMQVGGAVATALVRRDPGIARAARKTASFLLAAAQSRDVKPAIAGIQLPRSR
jgi:hypothetical protein